jgi:hypothetical protein
LYSFLSEAELTPGAIVAAGRIRSIEKSSHNKATLYLYLIKPQATMMDGRVEI